MENLFENSTAEWSENSKKLVCQMEQPVYFYVFEIF